MSFHPSMDYGRGRHKSARALPEEGPAFVYTAERREKLETICARYPADQRKSAILAALYLAQHQQGYLTQNAMRHVAEVIGCTPAEVEDVVCTGSRPARAIVLVTTSSCSPPAQARSG